jgi:hypothetical protein
MSSAPIPAAAVRTVCSYPGGVQIEDAGHQIQIRFTDKPKTGVPGSLWNAGFRRKDGVFIARNVPATIFAAQAILNTRYGSKANG